MLLVLTTSRAGPRIQKCIGLVVVKALELQHDTLFTYLHLPFIVFALDVIWLTQRRDAPIAVHAAAAYFSS